MDPVPLSSKPPSDMVLNRHDRDGLAKVIRQFLNDEIKAFALDDAVFEYGASPDPTVRYVAQQVWCFYDDFKDHPVRLCKTAWDYFQRLLLVLDSDRFILHETVSSYSRTQLAAVALLIGALFILTMTTSAGWYALLFVVGGLVTAVNHHIRLQEQHRLMDLDRRQSLFPFDAISEMKQALKSAPAFRKQLYRPELAHRRIRSWDVTLHLPCEKELVAFGFWPFVFLFQMFPVKARWTNVSAPL